MSQEEATRPAARGQEGPYVCGPTTSGDALYPLSYFPVPPVEGTGVHRRRARRRAARAREANEAVFGLNFLAGYGAPRSERAVDVDNSLHDAAVDNILNLTAADAMLVGDLRRVPNLNLRRFD